jgi:hypothetical protein
MAMSPRKRGFILYLVQHVPLGATPLFPLIFLRFRPPSWNIDL